MGGSFPVKATITYGVNFRFLYYWRKERREKRGGRCD